MVKRELGAHGLDLGSGGSGFCGLGVIHEVRTHVHWGDVGYPTVWVRVRALSGDQDGYWSGCLSWLEPVVYDGCSVVVTARHDSLDWKSPALRRVELPVGAVVKVVSTPETERTGCWRAQYGGALFNLHPTAFVPLEAA